MTHGVALEDASRRDERTGTLLARSYILAFRASLHGCAKLKESVSMGRLFGRSTSRGLAVAVAILAAIGLTTVPRPADAGGGGGGSKLA